MRTLALVFGALLLAALLGVGGLALALRPPRVPVPPRGARLGDVTVVQPGEARIPHRTLRVEGDRIDAVEEASAGDGNDRWAGSYVLPGLVDLHVHHPPTLAIGERELFAALFLRYGVTTVRDVGSAWPGTLLRHGRRIDEGLTPGPRLRSCGPFLDGDPPDWPYARVLRTPEEARAAVQELAAQGFDCVKLYNSLAPDVVEAVQQAAAQADLPVVAHVPWSVRLEDLHDCEVQHLMGLMEDRPDPGPAEIARYVRTSQRNQLRHTPTLVTFERASELGALDLDALPGARLLPDYYPDVLWRVDRNALAREHARDADVRLRGMERLVRALHAGGVTVLAGTDTMNPAVVPGSSLQEELRLLAEAGLGAEGAWRAATVQAGEALRIPGLGRIERGAPADLLVFARDPSDDLDALDSLRAVVADGRLYTREDLEAAAQRLAAPLHRAPYEPLASGAASLLISWLGRGS